MDITRVSSRTSTVSYVKNNSSGSNLRLHPVISSDGNTLEKSFAISEEFYYMVHNSGQLDSEVDCKMAGMKIFASIMLNAWRRRRDDVKKLTEDLNRLKRGVWLEVFDKKSIWQFFFPQTIKTQNKLHVLSSLFKIERKQNESLKDQVHRLNSEKRALQISYEELGELNEDILVKSKILEEQVGFKNEEIEAMNIVLEDTKAQLFQAMNQVRESDSLKCLEQRKVQELENQKNHLMSEVRSFQLRRVTDTTVSLIFSFPNWKLKWWAWKRSPGKNVIWEMKKSPRWKLKLFPWRRNPQTLSRGWYFWFVFSEFNIFSFQERSWYSRIHFEGSPVLSRRNWAEIWFGPPKAGDPEFIPQQVETFLEGCSCT